MRRYETTVIVDPDLSEADRTLLFDRVKEIIVQQQGVLIAEDHWGTKKLAYEIKKKPRGYYARYDYCGMGPLVSELERFFRIDDRLMKYLTVLLDAEADAEKILAEAASTQEPESEEPSEPAAQAETASATDDKAEPAPATDDKPEPAPATDDKPEADGVESEAQTEAQQSKEE